ncbi:MAG: hypothetical protein WCG34_09650 [Leptolinea sp.]
MVQNITLSAEKDLIEKARRRAEAQKTSLNAEFRRWLEHYAEGPLTISNLTALMDRLSYARPDKTFTRDELNER